MWHVSSRSGVATVTSQLGQLSLASLQGYLFNCVLHNEQ